MLPILVVKIPSMNHPQQPRDIPVIEGRKKKETKQCVNCLNDILHLINLKYAHDLYKNYN